MDWSNEDYVRMYTRTTADDQLLSWQALALWRAMLCQFDRSGLIDTRHGVRGLAALVRMPLQVVSDSLVELLTDGRVQAKDVGYFAPNFMAAQTASKSDRQRQRDARERRAADAHASPNVNEKYNHVTPRDESELKRHDWSQAVTTGHDPSQVVTLCSALLCSADPLLCSADPEKSGAAHLHSHSRTDTSDSPQLDAFRAKVDAVTKPARDAQAEADAIAARPTRKRRLNSQLSDAWEPSRSAANVAAEAEARGRGIEPHAELPKLRDWAKAKQVARADWDAQYRNWLRGARPTQGWSSGRTALQRQLEDIALLEREEAHKHDPS